MERLEQTAVKVEVLNDVVSAVWRTVDVSVVAHGEDGLQTVTYHAGHGHSQKPICLIILKNISALAM